MIIAVVFYQSISMAQDLQLIKWLDGNWTAQGDQSDYFEQWAFISAVQMIGNGTELTKSDTLSSEQLKIFKRNQKYYFAAKVNKAEFVEFEIIDLHKNGFTAINLAHDFPQRIIYTRKNRKSFHARVEAGDGAQLKGFDIHYYKSRRGSGFGLGVSTGGIGFQF